MRIITSKFPSDLDGDGCFANTVDTIVTNAPSQKKFRFIERLTVANTAIDAKSFEAHRYVAAVQEVSLIFTRSGPVETSGVRYNDAYGPRYHRTRTVYGD